MLTFIYNSLKPMFSSVNKTYMIALVVVLLLLIGYFVYKNSFMKTSFTTENMENNESSSNKKAEMLLFYADWCPHCKTAKPEWENMKADYEGKTINGYKVFFTEHNCSQESPQVEELMNKYKVEGFPTIKLLKDNQVVEFDAKPTKATMEQYLNSVL